MTIFMEKVKTALLNINFSLIGFVAYVTKLILTGASLPDALVFISISALFGYSLYLKSKSPDPVRISKELKDQIEETNRRIRDMQMQNNLQNKPKFRF